MTMTHTVTTYTLHEPSYRPSSSSSSSLWLFLHTAQDVDLGRQKVRHHNQSHQPGPQDCGIKRFVHLSMYITWCSCVGVVLPGTEIWVDDWGVLVAVAWLSWSQYCIFMYSGICRLVLPHPPTTTPAREMDFRPDTHIIQRLANWQMEVICLPQYFANHSLILGICLTCTIFRFALLFVL